MRNPRLIEKPRIAEVDERTPANVGPGSYLGKQDKGLNVVKKPQPVPNLQFGTDRRFKYENEAAELPGPGQYNE